MIQAPSLLDDLQEKGVMLSLTEQGNLSYAAPEDVMTPGMIETIRAHKAELLVLLQATNAAPRTPAPAPAAPGLIDITPFYRTVANTRPPLHCRNCHNTQAERWRLNQLRNRWECTVCEQVGMLNYDVVIVASTGEDAVTECVAFLDKLQEQGVTVRYYDNGQCGVTVPPAWDDRQFDAVVTAIQARDAMLRRLIPSRRKTPGFTAVGIQGAA
jgi:hypothetical protein